MIKLDVEIVAKDYADNNPFISAEVESSFIYDSYSADLEIDNQKGIMSCDCECPAKKTWTVTLYSDFIETI